VGHPPVIPGQLQKWYALSVSDRQQKTRGVFAPPARAASPVLPFGVAGLVAGTAWLLPLDYWGRAWFWALSLLFAAAVLLTPKVYSCSVTTPNVPPARLIGAALVLSAAWPLSVIAFGTVLMQVAKLQPQLTTLDATLTMLTGALTASLCVSLALRLLTIVWDVKLLCYLFLCGAILVLLDEGISSATNIGPSSVASFFQTPRGSLALLVLPGSTLYGALFGLGLLRAVRFAPSLPA